MRRDNSLWNIESLEAWEKENLDATEARRRAIERRIEDLQERESINPGEEIELKKLLSLKWDSIVFVTEKGVVPYDK